MEGACPHLMRGSDREAIRMGQSSHSNLRKLGGMPPPPPSAVPLPRFAGEGPRATDCSLQSAHPLGSSPRSGGGVEQAKRSETEGARNGIVRFVRRRVAHPPGNGIVFAKHWGEGLLHSRHHQMLRSAEAASIFRAIPRAPDWMPQRAPGAKLCSRMERPTLVMRASVRPLGRWGTDLFSPLNSHSFLPARW